MTIGPTSGEIYVDAQEQAQEALVECRRRLDLYLNRGGIDRLSAAQIVSSIEDLMNAWAHKRRLDE